MSTEASVLEPFARSYTEPRRLIRLKLRRADSDEPTKNLGEMARVRQAANGGGFQNTAARIAQRNLCAFDSFLQHVAVRRAAHAPLEQLGKMVGAHASQSGEVEQAQIFRQMVTAGEVDDTFALHVVDDIVLPLLAGSLAPRPAT